MGAANSSQKVSVAQPPVEGNHRRQTTTLYPDVPRIPTGRGRTAQTAAQQREAIPRNAQDEVILHHQGWEWVEPNTNVNLGAAGQNQNRSATTFRSEMSLDEILVALERRLLSTRPTSPSSDPSSEPMGWTPVTPPTTEGTFQRSNSVSDLLDAPTDISRDTGIYPAKPRPLMSVATGLGSADSPQLPRGNRYQNHTNLKGNARAKSSAATAALRNPGDGASKGRQGLTRKKAFKSQPNLLDIGDLDVGQQNPKDSRTTAAKQQVNNTRNRKTAMTAPRPNPSHRVMTRERLMELLDKPIREVVFVVQNFASGFISLLNQTDVDDEVVVEVTKVLAGIAQCHRCPHTARAFLQTVLYTPFVEHRLPQYLQTAPYDGGSYVPVLTDVVTLLERLSKEFGSEAEAKVRRWRILLRKAIEESIRRDGDLDADLKRALVEAQTEADAEWPMDPIDPNEESLSEGSRDQKWNLFQELRQTLVQSLSEALGRPDRSIYHGVSIVVSECSVSEGLIHRLQWSSSAANPRVDPTRFLLGALVFLAQTMAGPFYCATVAKRDRKCVWVRFPDCRAVQGLTTDLVLVESFSYVGDCWSPMAGLRMSRDVSLPFQSYFDGRAVGLRHPGYLDCDSTYCLQELGVPVRVLDKKNWPVPPADKSDLVALKHALTAEIALVHSPPGSDPVLFGLGILRTLIANESVVRKGCEAATPILLLCHSDDVLDRVLGGVLQHTLKVVRVGGRVTAPDLAGYELDRHRNLLRDAKRIPTHVAHLRKVLYEKLRKFQAEETLKRQLLELVQEHVLKLDTLRPVMTDDFHRQFQNAYGSGGVDPLVKWLTTGAPETSRLPKVTGRSNDLEAVLHEEEYCDYAYYVADREIARRVPLVSSDEFVDLESQPLTGGKSAGDFVVRHEVVDLGLWGRRDDIRAEVNKGDSMSEVEFARLGCGLTTLSRNDRWRLYRGWLAVFQKRTRMEMEAVQGKYTKAFLQMQEVRREIEASVLQQAQVVGMTAVAAAQYHSLLHVVRPRIVLVLDAGMVPEMHVAVTLTDRCQHLIVIGDHQQLKWKLHNSWQEQQLDNSQDVVISIFQSLLNFGIPSLCLPNGGRKALAIHQLLRGLFPDRWPSEDLPASADVVSGMDSSVYFLSHNDHPESSVDTPGSYANEYEAEFLVCLAAYLMQRGYRSSQITIVAAYGGQCHLLKRLVTNRFEKERVECVTVQEHQGRSNDIVLLSLVRSNGLRDVGRLADQDVIYVALSGARVGLYCIGDFRMLAAAVDFWKCGVTFLAERRWYGSALTLRCVHHPAEATLANSPQDLRRMASESCGRVCNAVMPCGHRCPKPCHDDKRGHEKVHCTRPCPRTACELGHPCLKKCFEECGQCTMQMKCSFPCGHSISASCCERPLACPAHCDKRLPCGHGCPKKCGEPCDPDACVELIEHRDPTCKHVFPVTCCEKQAAGKRPIPCRAPCGAVLRCGHRCRGLCGQCQQGRMHVPCKEPCERVLICGHDCSAPCGRDCPPCERACDIQCSHGKCQASCGRPCVPCSEPCPWRCVHFRCGRMCFEMCDRPRCEASCRRILPCGHQCIGLCGEPCPPACRVCNAEALLATGVEAVTARYVWLEDCKHLVEASMADRIMLGGAGAVQSRRCPVCNRAIRKSSRYGNVLKEAAADIARIHRLYLQVDPEAARRGADRLRRTAGTFADLTFHAAERQLGQEYAKSPDGHGLQVLDNKVSFLAAMARLWHAVDGQTARKKFVVHDELVKLQHWHRQLTTASSARQLEAFAMELRCVAYLVYVLTSFPGPLTSNQQILYSYILKRLVSHSDPVDDFDATIITKLRELCQLCNRAFDETVIDLVDITDVWCIANGHWWKCPNGHVYHAGVRVSGTMPKCKQCPL